MYLTSLYVARKRFFGGVEREATQVFFLKSELRYPFDSAQVFGPMARLRLNRRRADRVVPFISTKEQPFLDRAALEQPGPELAPKIPPDFPI